MWTCPDCGVELLTRNLSHSCGRSSVGEWRERGGPHGRALLARLEGAVARCGAYTLSPARTRIAFVARVRFASVSALSEKGMTFGFMLPRPLESPRFARVEEVVPGWWSHRLRVTRVEELDAEVEAWLAESYRLMGMRERLRRER
jgi:hypothetical protein